jgi:multidrug resistance efflux pump
MAKRIVGFVFVACLLIVVLVISQLRPKPLEVSGFVEAHEIRVGSRVGGRVRRVQVEEGQEVRQGDLLVELEPFDLLERRAEAEAGLAAIDRQIEELKVTAPVNGIVEAVDLEPGDLVSANAPTISIMDTSDLWVRAYVPEDELDLHIDQEVKVTVDSYRDRKFTGRVSFIARQAEFTPGNVQTPEGRSKQVFRIKVTLVEGKQELRPGMAANVLIEAGGEME